MKSGYSRVGTELAARDGNPSTFSPMHQIPSGVW
jgi:hypothetical protein